MRNWPKIAFAVLLILVAGSSEAAEQTTLAILTGTKELRAHADVLTAAFSGVAGVTLLERDQIDKVLREQELSLAQVHDAVKIGRLINAKGILLLERETEAPTKS